MTLNDIKDYIQSNVTLHFVKYDCAEAWFTQTEIGYYEVEYSGGSYSIMTPDEDDIKGMYSNRANTTIRRGRHREGGRPRWVRLGLLGGGYSV